VLIPEHVTGKWIATLGDDQLITAESMLHAVFLRHERAEKSRSGARYSVLQGPPVLVNAWLRWLLVSNATRSRGLTVRHTPH
jgi:hypothetical protein